MDMDAKTLMRELEESRRRTLELVADLDEEQMMGPLLSIVNPPLWEIGHVAWFQERWILRHLYGQEPVDSRVDELYNSAEVAHDHRWEIPLLPRQVVSDYMKEVLHRVLERLDSAPLTEEQVYFHLLALFHEDMHTEAFTYTRQTLGYAPPPLSVPCWEPQGGGPLSGEVELEGGEFQLGAFPGRHFVFDNEKWAHPVTIPPFRIARAPVTNQEYAAFVEEGGYDREEFWSREGWPWRCRSGRNLPRYWRRDSGGFLRRHFDRWIPLEPHHPVIHVCWYEAEAYCRWAGRRLPSEAEWELAASVGGAKDSSSKPTYPWGEERPKPEHANLDWQAGGCVEVGCHPAGEAASGCRQLLGNVWEWTASVFGPYPGFERDPYKEYSEPWFGDHRVLRGGSWATRSRLIRNTWRNFFKPERQDIFAGFRTCASE